MTSRLEQGWLLESLPFVLFLGVGTWLVTCFPWVSLSAAQCFLKLVLASLSSQGGLLLGAYCHLGILSNFVFEFVFSK